MNEQEIYTPYDAQINALEERLAQLRAERNNYINQLKNIEDERDSYRNAYEAMFDGIKFVADHDNPIPVSYPMFVRENLIYSTSENDGIKDVITRWVAVSTTMLTEDNFSDVMERYDLNDE